MVTTAKRPKSAPAVETSRMQRRRQETSERIFVAAMELFSRKGFVETTVEEITRAADVGKGTFFNYFPSKEHVLGYLVAKQAAIVEQHLALTRLGTTTSEKVLISLGSSLVKFPGKSPQMARSLISSFFGNVEVREYIVGQLTEKRRWIAEIIRLGQHRGELRTDSTPIDVARAFHHMLFGTVLLWALDPSSPLEKQLSKTMGIFLCGLNASSKPEPKARQREVSKTRHKSEAR